MTGPSDPVTWISHLHEPNLRSPWFDSYIYSEIYRNFTLGNSNLFPFRGPFLEAPVYYRVR